MMNSIIYKFAAFSLPRDLIALCALKGGYQRIGRSLARRWECLMVGTLDDQVKHACALAAKLNEGQLSVHGNATLTPEKLISKVRTICQGAVPYANEYPGEHKARISGFLFEIEQDRMAQWKNEFETQSQAFELHQPVLRCPYNKMVYQKVFPPTATGFASWQNLRNEAPAYVRATALIRGGGEV